MSLKLVKYNRGIEKMSQKHWAGYTSGTYVSSFKQLRAMGKQIHCTFACFNEMLLVTSLGSC